MPRLSVNSFVWDISGLYRTTQTYIETHESVNKTIWPIRHFIVFPDHVDREKLDLSFSLLLISSMLLSTDFCSDALSVRLEKRLFVIKGYLAVLWLCDWVVEETDFLILNTGCICILKITLDYCLVPVVQFSFFQYSCYDLPFIP